MFNVKKDQRENMKNIAKCLTQYSFLSSFTILYSTKSLETMKLHFPDSLVFKIVPMI